MQGVGWEQEENVEPGQNNLPEAVGGGKEWEIWSLGSQSIKREAWFFRVGEGLGSTVAGAEEVQW